MAQGLLIALHRGGPTVYSAGFTNSCNWLQLMMGVCYSMQSMPRHELWPMGTWPFMCQGMVHCNMLWGACRRQIIAHGILWRDNYCLCQVGWGYMGGALYLG